MRHKVIMSALAALGVLSAFGTGAAAAQAQFVVHSDVNPTILKETNWTGMVLTINAGNTKCSQGGQSIKYTENDIPNIVLAPVMSSCAFAGLSETWNFNGCTEVSTPTSKTTGTFSIACPAGKEIDITINKECHVYIPAQTPTNPTVGFQQQIENGIKTLLLRTEVTGLTYHSTGGWCGQSGTNGKLGGSGLVRGYSNEKFESQYLHSIAIAEIP